MPTRPRAILGVAALCVCGSLVFWRTRPSASVSPPLYLQATGVTATPAPCPTPTAVPPYYQCLAAYVQAQLDAFAPTLSARDTVTSTAAPVPMGTELERANGNAAPQIIAPNPYPRNTCPNGYVSVYGSMCSITTFIDRMKELGLQSLTLGIKWPLLSPHLVSMETVAGEGTDAQYAAFYAEVADQVRARGMHVIVESNLLFAGTAFSAFQYTPPDFCTYEADANVVAQRVIDTVHPDILQVLEEPDTQFNLSGYAQFDPTNAAVGGARGAAAFVRAVVGDAPDPQCPGAVPVPLRKISVLSNGATVTTTVTAGTGTWLAADRTCPVGSGPTCTPGVYAAALAGVAGLDALDMHIYPLSNSAGYHFLDNALDVADTAHTAGKAVTISEFWDTKEDPSGFPAGGLPNYANLTDDYRISAFSFWTPQDTTMLSTMAHLAQVTGMLSVSAFWSDFFLTNVAYTPGVYDETTSYATMSGVINRQVTAALVADTFTADGLFLRTLLTPPGGLPTSTPTVTPTPTATPRPTRTPWSTRTPVPTRTPRPTRTPWRT
jgi:hypothetical protein